VARTIATMIPGMRAAALRRHFQLEGGVLLRDYHRTRNPIIAWEIYQLARETEQPIPEAIARYLDAAAENILKVAIAELERPETALASALGLVKPKRGPGSPIAEYRNYHRDRMLAGDAFRAVERIGKDTIAFEEVAAAHGVSAATVRRAYLRFRAYYKAEFS
jgi:hypothetical protein